MLQSWWAQLEAKWEKGLTTGSFLPQASGRLSAEQRDKYQEDVDAAFGSCPGHQAVHVHAGE